VLLDAVAAKWNVPVAELTTEPSVVVHAASGRRISYGEIAAFAQTPAELPKIEDKDLKLPARFRLIGKDLPRFELPTKVMGAAKYAMEAQVPGMVYAAVLQSASSSSAKIAGSVVNEPCPNSAAGDMMLMVPSAAMVSQTLGANVVSAAASLMSARGSTDNVSARVRPAAVSLRNSRRLSCWVMAQASRAARWMALMILRYVPQRQMLPVMCSTICLRVGFLLLAMSSAACMIWPDWQ